jgi:hypothetical protein
VEPEPVILSEVLEQVAETYSNHIALPTGAADALALAVAHFHCVNAFTYSPRLSFQAVAPACGKTTALMLTAALSPLPIIIKNGTAAVLFRAADLEGVTLALDEVDTWLCHNDNMRGIVNAVSSTADRCCAVTSQGRSFAPRWSTGLPY